MIDSGMLTVSAQFDIEEFPEIYLAVIGVKLNVRWIGVWINSAPYPRCCMF